MDYFFLALAIIILTFPFWMPILHGRIYDMFIGKQWHIPTSRECRETIEVRHEDLSEPQWVMKKLPDRAFHVLYEDSTDQAVVYHRTSKGG